MNLNAPVASAPVANCCPICGRANLCAMELEKQSGMKQPPCWCASMEFTAELLAQIPPAARGLACVCANCAKGALP
jgi:hypothetical protein